MIQIKTIFYNLKFEFTFILAIVLSACQSSTSSLELPSLFSDNMVLQRNANVQLWGNSETEQILYQYEYMPQHLIIYQQLYRQKALVGQLEYKIHHKHLGKEDGECFGMLNVPNKYFKI